MLARDVVQDRQPEPDAAALAIARRLEAVERLEHALELGGADSSTSATSATSALDPLDTNGDGTLNSTELGSFKTHLDGAIDTAMASLQASGTSSSSGSSSSDATGSSSGSASSPQDSVSLSSLVDLMLKQYSQAAAAATSSSTTASTLSVTA